MRSPDYERDGVRLYHGRCEDVLPLFADHRWVGVTGESGEQIGRLSATQVIKALARYSAAPPAAQVVTESA